MDERIAIPTFGRFFLAFAMHSPPFYSNQVDHDSDSCFYSYVRAPQLKDKEEGKAAFDANSRVARLRHKILQIGQCGVM
jgi:hypothetical protein